MPSIISWHDNLYTTIVDGTEAREGSFIPTINGRNNLPAQVFFISMNQSEVSYLCRQ